MYRYVYVHLYDMVVPKFDYGTRCFGFNSPADMDVNACVNVLLLLLKTNKNFFLCYKSN